MKYCGQLSAEETIYKRADDSEGKLWKLLPISAIFAGTVRSFRPLLAEGNRLNSIVSVHPNRISDRRGAKNQEEVQIWRIGEAGN